MNAFRFATPEFLWLSLFCIPFSITIITRNRHRSIPWLRIALVSLQILFLSFALSRPQMGKSQSQSLGIKSQIFFAIDISRSMLSEDLVPNRLQFAKAFLLKLFPELEPAKLAIFPMTESGYLQLPLTNDWHAASDVLNSLNPELVSNPGTDLGKSLENLFTILTRLEQKSTASGTEWLPTQIVLLSDGESHQPVENQFLRPFYQKKIPIHTVAVGTTAGGKLPSDRRSLEPWPYLRDQAGKEILSKLDLVTLQRIADTTGGKLFKIGFDAILPLKATLKQQAAIGRIATSFKVEWELFPYGLLLAFLCMLLDLPTRRWRQTVAIGLFCFFSVLDSSTAKADRKEWESMDDKTRSIAIYNEGVKELKAQNFKLAAEYFQEAATLTTDAEVKKQALYNLGNSYFKQMDPTQALESYQQAMTTKSSNDAMEAQLNRKTSDNIALAKTVLEELKRQQQQQGEGEPSDDEGSDNSKPKDRNGPEKFKAQEFDSDRKKKIYDLIASEEQQTMQRILEGRNRGQSKQLQGKPW